MKVQLLMGRSACLQKNFGAKKGVPWRPAPPRAGQGKDTRLRSAQDKARSAGRNDGRQWLALLVVASTKLSSALPRALGRRVRHVAFRTGVDTSDAPIF